MDKKNVMITVLAVLLAAVVAGGGVYIWQQNDDDEATLELAEPVDDTATSTLVTDGDDTDTSTVSQVNEDAEPVVSDRDQISAALADKLNYDPDDLDVNFDEVTDEHANGTVGFADAIGGGWWLAAKPGNDWLIVADGNGVIMCDLIEPYDFPTSMVPECWDGTQNVVR